MDFLIYLGFFILSFGLTAVLRTYALKVRCLDLPNHRSSHRVPTPRGGGLAFVVCFILALLLAVMLEKFSLRLFLVFLFAGGGVATLGWLDDRYGLTAWIRLLAQSMLALVAVWGLGLTQTGCLGWSVVASVFFGVFYLVWLTNLFNFMDGIDGLAVTESIFVAGGLILLGILLSDIHLNFILGCLIAALAGFTLWNFPRAYIFMGDVGSGFLGMALGIASLVFAQKSTTLFAAGLILMGVFISDATITLFVRGVRKERVWEAHRQHTYQHLARHWGSHVRVTLCVGIVNLVWLLPMAVLTVKGIWPPIWGIAIAYFPLIILMIKGEAGQPDAHIPAKSYF